MIKDVRPVEELLGTKDRISKRKN